MFNMLIKIFVKITIGANKINPLITTEAIGRPLLYPFCAIATIPSTRLIRDIANMKFIIIYEIAILLLKPIGIGDDKSMIAWIIT